MKKSIKKAICMVTATLTLGVPCFAIAKTSAKKESAQTAIVREFAPVAVLKSGSVPVFAVPHPLFGSK